MRAAAAGEGGEGGAIAEMEAHGYTGGICYELCYECWMHDNADNSILDGYGCFENNLDGSECASQTPCLSPTLFANLPMPHTASFVLTAAVVEIGL